MDKASFWTFLFSVNVDFYCIFQPLISCTLVPWFLIKSTMKIEKRSMFFMMSSFVRRALEYLKLINKCQVFKTAYFFIWHKWRVYCDLHLKNIRIFRSQQIELFIVLLIFEINLNQVHCAFEQMSFTFLRELNLLN